eukprot:TRINITY_DN109_c0_g1_i2.p1 TRINITY_DN109_c0_g1~~TRINITY_DN109_c0_g1_i2.p1  ORF type:complete len:526 (-),score=120.42 TRINITY_DN109_c0_g1_i2:1802-3379(-)
MGCRGKAKQVVLDISSPEFYLAAQKQALKKGCLREHLRFSLRTVLIAFTVVVVTVSVVPMAVTLFRSSRRSIDMVVSSLTDSVQSYIEQNTANILDVPSALVEGNSEYFAMIPQDPSIWINMWQYFYVQTRTTPTVGSFMFTALDLSTVVITTSNAAYDTQEMYSVTLLCPALYNGDQALHYYILPDDPTSLPANYSEISISSITYDQESMMEAVLTGELRVSQPQIFPFSFPTLKYYLVLWVIKSTVANGIPFGITMAQFNLDHVSRAMSQVEIGKTGYAYLIQRTGDLVATSTLTPVLTEEGKRVNTLNGNCSNKWISCTTHKLNEKVHNFTGITEKHRIETKCHGKKLYVSVSPYTPQTDVDWLLVIAIPRSDFLAKIDKDSNITLGVVVALMVGSVLMSLVLTTLITRPLKRTTLCLNYISQMELHKARETEGNRSLLSEIDSLRRSTRVMISSLNSFQKFVPVSVVQSLVAQKMEAHLGVNPAEVTVFFSDVRDFTGHSERLSLTQLVTLHTEYMDAVTL